MALARALQSLSTLVLAAAVSGASAQEHAASPTHVVFHESPVVDLYFHVRAVAKTDGTSRIEGLRPAVDAARELDRTLGGNALAWGPLEGLLLGAESAADVEQAFARAPESLELRGGTRVALRAGARKLAAALVQAEPAFEELCEQGYRAAIGRARWEEHVAEKEAELFAFHLESLGMRDPGLAIPVYLVAEAPWPGAVTHLDEAGKGVCFVAVDPVPGSLFFEVVLHEATHALDVATRGESALGELERKLAAAGLDARARAVRDLPHALLFVQSAESIRRVIEPAHRDYGEVEKVYERFGPSAEAVRGFWRDHLDGALTQAEALDEIVASLAPARK